MTTTRRPARLLWALPLLLVVALPACAADPGPPDAGAAPAADTAPDETAPDATAPDDTAPDDTAPGTTVSGDVAGGAAGICLEGSADCDDTPGATGTGGPESGADGSVPIEEAVAAGIQGPFLMSGFLVVDAEGARLCQALAESFPPQCGGTAVALDPAEAPAGAVTTTEGDVTWTEQPVLVEGELVDGTFVVRTA